MGKSFKALSLMLGITLLAGIVGITAGVALYTSAPFNRYQEIFISKVMAKIGRAPATSDKRDLQSKLEEYLRGRSGVYGVAIRNLNTGETVLINEDHVFISASTYKVLVMYKVYREMQRGTLNADEELTITESDIIEDELEGELYLGETMTVGEALEAMITVSSNASAYALTRLMGGWGSINAAAADLGMTQTGSRDGYFWTTPSDMLIFFEALAEGRLVSASASLSMVGLLQRQQVNDRIPALLPPGTAVAHKTGELSGVRNDVGIVYAPSGPYIIGVFSQWANEEEATNVIARVSLYTYEHYSR